MTGTAAAAARADPRRGGPSLGSAFRAAASDFYFNSWRLVPANVVWALTLLAALIATVTAPPLALLLAVAAIPTAGIARMAALVARGEAVSLSDFVSGMRTLWRRAVALGLGTIALGLVFSVNVVLGLEAAAPPGWFFSVLALYADLGLVMVVLIMWPLLADPWRSRIGLASAVRLAATVALARPGRIAVLAVVTLAILVLSTALFAVLVTVAVAYTQLVAARYVLPIADRIVPPGAAPKPEPGSAD